MPKRTPVYIDKERLMCYLFDIQLEDFDLMRKSAIFQKKMSPRLFIAVTVSMKTPADCLPILNPPFVVTLLTS